jgi:hypothetical protein
MAAAWSSENANFFWSARTRSARPRASDDRDDFVDMVERFSRAEQDVLALLCLAEVELRAALHHLAAVLDEVLEHALERERLRHAVHEREHVVVEGALELGVLVEIIQNGLRMRRALELDDDADVGGRFVAQVADALELLLLHEVGDARDELALFTRYGIEVMMICVSFLPSSTISASPRTTTGPCPWRRHA